MWLSHLLCSHFFFFNDTATTEIYTLSLHDALPILLNAGRLSRAEVRKLFTTKAVPVTLAIAIVLAVGSVIIDALVADRKSTRLNSSHGYISYAGLCLKKTHRTCRSTLTISERRTCS